MSMWERGRGRGRGKGGEGGGGRGRGRERVEGEGEGRKNQIWCILRFSFSFHIFRCWSSHPHTLQGCCSGDPLIPWTSVLHHSPGNDKGDIKREGQRKSSLP